MKDPKLTKSLFVEFVTDPHVARWHMHDKDVYQKIMEKVYGDMDGLAVGKAAEEQVCHLFVNKKIVNVEKIQRKHPDRYQWFHNVTMEAVAQSPDVIYQPAFLYDNLFVKCDFLVKNEQWTYDIREVKAKNNVRKKTKSAELLDELEADVSFQDFVVKKTLKEKYSGKIFLVYMNKEYVRHGDIVPEEVLKVEEVTGELKKEEAILNIITSMTNALKLEREEFKKLYPYDNDDHLTFFGKEADKWSIWNIPQIRTKKNDLFAIGKILIEHFTEDERGMLFSVSGEETRASKYVSLWQQGEKWLDKPGIKEKFDTLHFPLFFYDYETINWPVPLLEWTSPWQQCVVQYSVHRMDADGTISHKEAIVGSWTHDNQTIVDQLIQDLEGGAGTYVVWFKGFENTRNDEMAKMYPQYEEAFRVINENTFDLMELFSEQLYFHRAFNGSSSIKKVLPVLTDITYDGLAVSHGSIAAELLAGIVQGKYDTDTCDRHIQNLLEYCKQDTWAMVRIYQKVLEEISE